MMDCVCRDVSCVWGWDCWAPMLVQVRTEILYLLLLVVNHCGCMVFLRCDLCREIVHPLK